MKGFNVINMKKNKKPKVLKIIFIGLIILLFEFVLILRLGKIDDFTQSVIIIFFNSCLLLIGSLNLNDAPTILSKYDFLKINNDDTFYKEYLDLMIDSLYLLEKYITRFDEDMNYKQLLKIEKLFNSLKEVEPPKKYEDFHKTVLIELDLFILKNKELLVN